MAYLVLFPISVGLVEEVDYSVKDDSTRRADTFFLAFLRERDFSDNVPVFHVGRDRDSYAELVFSADVLPD